MKTLVIGSYEPQSNDSTSWVFSTTKDMTNIVASYIKDTVNKSFFRMTNTLMAHPILYCKVTRHFETNGVESLIELGILTINNTTIKNNVTDPIYPVHVSSSTLTDSELSFTIDTPRRAVGFSPIKTMDIIVRNVNGKIISTSLQLPYTENITIDSFTGLVPDIVHLFISVTNELNEASRFSETIITLDNSKGILNGPFYNLRPNKINYFYLNNSDINEIDSIELLVEDEYIPLERIDTTDPLVTGLTEENRRYFKIPTGVLERDMVYKIKINYTDNTEAVKNISTTNAFIPGFRRRAALIGEVVKVNEPLSTKPSYSDAIHDDIFITPTYPVYNLGTDEEINNTLLTVDEKISEVRALITPDLLNTLDNVTALHNKVIELENTISGIGIGLKDIHEEISNISNAIVDINNNIVNYVDNTNDSETILGLTYDAKSKLSASSDFLKVFINRLTIQIGRRANIIDAIEVNIPNTYCKIHNIGVDVMLLHYMDYDGNLKIRKFYVAATKNNSYFGPEIILSDHGIVDSTFIYNEYKLYYIEDNTIKTFDLSTNVIETIFETGLMDVHGLNYHSNGLLTLTGINDNTRNIYVYDLILNTLTFVNIFTLGDTNIISGALHNGNICFVNSNDPMSLGIYNITNFNLITLTYPVQTDYIYNIIALDNSTLLYTNTGVYELT